MKKLALFLLLAACLGLSAFAVPPEHAQNNKNKQSTDCGGPRQEPCPEPPPPDDPPDDPSAPFAEAPPCESHDPTIWHGVFDPENGCHYQHHHGTDPASTPFADEVAQWPSLFDGEKHEGYIFLYVEGPFNSDGWAPDLIGRALLRVHSTGTVQHMQVRHHSNRFVAEICTADLTQCGTVVGGQLTDYGITHGPYKKIHLPRPDDPWGDLSGDGLTISGDEEQPPYKSLNQVADVNRILQSGVNQNFWQSLGPNSNMKIFFSPVPNELLGLAWRSVDAYGLTDGPDDFFSGNPPAENLLGGEYNHSRFCVFNIRLSLPTGAGPGFDGFTDDFGNLTTNCSGEGPNCWRLQVSADAPAVSKFSFSTGVSGGDCSAALSNIADFDVCFDSSGQPVDCLQGGQTSGWLQPALSH